MTPLSIDADRQAGTLAIRWDDGHMSIFDTTALRWSCPCAVCRGEWGRPGVLAGLDVLPVEELTLADVHLVGNYGLTPLWVSGHSSGIYSWEYLRSLCPCEECSSGE